MNNNVSLECAQTADGRTVARAVALLFGLSLLIGWLVGGATLGLIQADHRLLLGAHLAAMFGAAMLAAYGWTLPHLRLASGGRCWLTRGMVYTFFVAPCFGVLRGLLNEPALRLNGEPLNDAIFVGTNLLVALPAMTVATCWIAALCRASSPAVEIDALPARTYASSSG